MNVQSNQGDFTHKKAGVSEELNVSQNLRGHNFNSKVNLNTSPLKMNDCFKATP